MIESNSVLPPASSRQAPSEGAAEPHGTTGMPPARKRLTIAIPCESGRLHGHFGGCREFALVEVDADRKAVIHAKIAPAPEHQPGAFPRWLRDCGVRVVIAGGIGHRALTNFAHHGITVRAGTANSTIEALVAAYLGGQLNETPDGCSHHGHHHHGEQHHEHDHGGSSERGC